MSASPFNPGVRVQSLNAESPSRQLQDLRHLR
jgi:hypothetical protein